MGSITDRVNVGLAAVVLRRGSRYHHYVLLGERINPGHGHGEFSLPGGKPEPGETPSEAVQRELEEETGLTCGVNEPEPLGFWTYERFPERGLHFVTLYFAFNGDKMGNPENREPDKCRGWEWYRTDRLPAPIFCGAEGAIFEAAERF